MVETRRSTRALLGGAFGLVVLAGCRPAGDGAVACGELDPRNDNEVVLCNGVDQAVLARTALPEGEPPPGGWPGVVVLHGSAGMFDVEDGECLDTLTDQFEIWSDTLTREGYAVIIPSSFYSRGFCTTHKPLTVPRKFTDNEQLVVRTFDAAAAADWLCDDPRVDCSKLAVVGFSNGASTAMMLVLDDPARASDPRLADIADSASLVGGVAYYPGCGLESLISTDLDGDVEDYYYPYVPLWVPHAERDRLLDRCEESRDPQVDIVAEARGETEDMFELEVYAKAKHGFDVWFTGDPEADLEARTDAQEKTLARLSEWLK